MSVTAPVKKIRKKSGNQPQSQINKCFNEKRRRELENEVINQLEELLHTCLAEVRQPDKNGIVREATRQISEVLSRRQACPADCPLRAAPARSPLQAGEVSSTQHHYFEIGSLIEAVKHYTSVLGLILMEINSKGEIECVTENIKDLLFVERTELYKKSIFSLLHVEDHAKLRPLLRNTQSVGWGAADPDKYRNIAARFHVEASAAPDGSALAECVIHAAAVRAAPADEPGSVMCVIRRREPAAAPAPPAAPAPAPARPALVFRLDCAFRVLSCDLSGLDAGLAAPAAPLALVGARFLELVERADRARVAAHLQRVVRHGGELLVSEPYALRLGADGPRFRVCAHSRLFPTAGEPDFIMSTNRLVADDAEAPAPAAEPPFSINDFDLDAWGSAFALADGAGDAKERRDAPAAAAAAAADAGAPCAPDGAPPAPPPEQPNRLRTLLSSKKTNDPILKDLLNQKDEEGGGDSSAPHTPGSAPSPQQQPRAAPPPLAPHPAPHTNQMLKLLNDKADEDGEERGGRGSSALLSQLLAGGPGGSGAAAARSPATDNDLYLERIAGIKRKFDESKAAAGSPKRATPEHQQVTSSAAGGGGGGGGGGPGKSELCLKNQILVSLLARQQTTPPAPMPLPHPARAFPAQRPRPPPPAHPAHPAHAPRQHPHTLSTMLAGGRGGGVNGGEAAGAQSHLQLVLQGARGAYPPPAAHPAPHPVNLHYAAPAPSPHHAYNAPPPGGGSRGPSGDSEAPGDKTLSEILDELIENNERGSAPDHSLMDLDTRASPDYQGANERKAAINAITQSLMQCETVSKGPAPPGYPAAGAAAPYSAARARAFVEQHRARLLHLQESQQMLVSPEAAEQPQQDLGATISALVSATPPNVTLLPRADFHHMYHPAGACAGQLGPGYGPGKVGGSQQSAMLSRQRHGGGYGPSAAGASTALHTPLAPQAYLRAPRPTHGGGYYEDGDYCGDYVRRAPPAPPPHDRLPPGAGGTSEYVRNELRAVVGARSARPDGPAPDLDPLLAFDMAAPGGGGAGGRGAAGAAQAPPTSPSTSAAAGGEAAAGAGEASLLQQLLSQGAASPRV